jgi:hypothetical protein
MSQMAGFREFLSGLAIVGSAARRPPGDVIGH